MWELEEVLEWHARKDIKEFNQIVDRKCELIREIWTIKCLEKRSREKNINFWNRFQEKAESDLRNFITFVVDSANNYRYDGTIDGWDTWSQFQQSKKLDHFIIENYISKYNKWANFFGLCVIKLIAGGHSRNHFCSQLP